jgi:hypothetical protein
MGGSPLHAAALLWASGLKRQSEPSPGQMCQDWAQPHFGRGRAGPSLRADVAGVSSKLPAQLGTGEVRREYFCVA